MLFVAVDIGCIECGEPSNVIGVFTERKQAEQALAVHEKHQSDHWSGQHDFEIFEVSDLNKVSELPND